MKLKTLANSKPEDIIVSFDIVLGWTWTPHEKCGYSYYITEDLANDIITTLKRCAKVRHNAFFNVD